MGRQVALDSAARASQGNKGRRGSKDTVLLSKRIGIVFRAANLAQRAREVSATT